MSTPSLFGTSAPSAREPSPGSVASTRPRADWLSIPDTLPPQEDAAAWWVRRGQLEHASVASTMALALELLGLGASPDLILGVQRAGMEQVEHTKLCFGLAAAFGAGPVGPSTLDLSDGPNTSADAPSVARHLVRWSVAEELWAVEMAEAARHTVSPGIRGALETLASEGERHAELGWRCVRWLLACGGVALRREVSIALEEACDVDAREPMGPCAGLVGYGILSSPARREAQEEGRRGILAAMAPQFLDPFDIAMAIDRIAS